MYCAKAAAVVQAPADRGSIAMQKRLPVQECSTTLGPVSTGRRICAQAGSKPKT